MIGYINLNVTFYLNRIDKNNWESSIVIYSHRVHLTLGKLKLLVWLFNRRNNI